MPSWSNYTPVYDLILCRTATYQAMLNDLLGRSGSLPKLGDGSVVLDLGCGTGNLSREILTAYPGTTLIAVDHDSSMAKVFREKLFDRLSDKPRAGSVFFMEKDIAEAMDILSAMALYADYAFLVNVLFLLQEPEAILWEIARTLKPGGELRLSNPDEDTDLDALFDTIRRELGEKNEFQKFEKEFNMLKTFNETQLLPMLNRFSRETLQDLLRSGGFRTITHISHDHYAGQSILISAVT